MSITGLAIIYIIIWWIVFFAILPIDVERKKLFKIEGEDSELQKIRRDKKDEEHLWKLWEDGVRRVRVKKLDEALEAGAIHDKDALEAGYKL